MTGHLGSSKLKKSPCRSRRAVLGTVTSMAWVLQFRRRPTAKRINTIPNMGNQKNPVYSRHSSFTVWLGYQTENPILCVLCFSSFLTILAFLVFKLVWMCDDVKDQNENPRRIGSQSKETKARTLTYLYSFDHRQRVEVAQDTRSGVRHSH